MLVADAILTLAKPIPSNEQQDMEELHPELCFRIVRNPAAPEYFFHTGLPVSRNHHCTYETVKDTSFQSRTMV